MPQTIAGRSSSQAALAAFERGNTAFDHADWANAEAAYREALTYQPDYTLVRYNYGLLLLTTNRPIDAERELRAVISAEPEFAAAHLNLATALHLQWRYAEADEQFRAASALGYASPELTLNWSSSLTELGRFPEAAALLQPLLSQPEYCATAVTQLALVRSLEGRAEEAVELHRAVVRLSGGTAMAHTNLGVALLVAGQWTEGWVEYESRFDIDPHRQNFPWPRWNGEDLTGRKILLSCEQGLGDLIQFLRFADALIERGAEVWLLCTEQGEELLSTYPGIRCVARPPLPEFDYHSCLMSLPRVLGITRNNVPAKVPYLFANEPRREFWRARLPGQGTLRVGLVWRCSQGFIRDQWRSMNLEELAPIFGTPGVTFISLQKGPGLDELGRLGPTLGLHDLGPEYQAGNLGDTAAIIAELDLVISVDTSVTHLAGALARPVWLAVNQPPDWRWERTGSTSRWYPTVRLFRQRALNQWRPVVEEMRHALQQRLETPATPQG